MRREARFCPACGAYRNPPRDRRKRERSGREGLRLARLVIALYFAILVTIVPLYFLDEANRVAGVIVVSILDASIILCFIPGFRFSLGPLLVPRSSLAL